MGTVRYTQRARDDLMDIWLYIAPENPNAADRVIDRIQARCEQLRNNPKLGPARPDIAKPARALVAERWIIFYRLLEDDVQIVRIIDGVRDLSKLEWPSS